MIGLIQRVTQARVLVAGETVGVIETGLLALVAVRAADTGANAERLAQRLLEYRVFADARGRMNRSLSDIRGALLLVPQFTLAADTRKGRRASFTGAAPPDAARKLFEQLVATARARHPLVTSGRFGADMQVSLTNDGPVTFWIEA